MSFRSHAGGAVLLDHKKVGDEERDHCRVLGQRGAPGAILQTIGTTGSGNGPTDLIRVAAEAKASSRQISPVPGVALQFRA